MDVMQGRPSGPLSTQSPDRHISPKMSQQFFEKLVFWKTSIFYLSSFFLKNSFSQNYFCLPENLLNLNRKWWNENRKRKYFKKTGHELWVPKGASGGGALCTRPVCTASWKSVSMVLVTRAKGKIKKIQRHMCIFIGLYIYIYIVFFSQISRQNCLICAVRAFAYKKRLMILYHLRDVSKLCDPNPRLWTSSVNKYGVTFWKGCVNCAHLIYTPCLNQKIDKNEIRKKEPFARGERRGLQCGPLLPPPPPPLPPPPPPSSFLLPPSFLPPPFSSSLVWFCSCSWYYFRSVRLFTCIHIYIYIYTHIHTHMYIYIHTHKYVCIYIHTIYIYMYVYFVLASSSCTSSSSSSSSSSLSSFSSLSSLSLSFLHLSGGLATKRV